MSIIKDGAKAMIVTDKGENATKVRICHTLIFGVQSPGASIITRCAGTKSHTYDESWHRIECHILLYNRGSIQNK
jgi:hypothetical protein